MLQTNVWLGYGEGAEYKHSADNAKAVILVAENGKAMRVWITVLILSFMVSWATAQTQPEPYKFADPDSYRSPNRALLYSLLFPGGGQYYNHYYVKGALLTGAAGGGITLITLGAIHKNDYKNAKAMRNSGIAVLSLASVASMLDAYIMARAINSRNGYGKLHARLYIKPDGLVLRF